MGLLIAAGTLLFGFGAAYMASGEVRYLTRAGIEETQILVGRVPMSRLADDSSQPVALRDAAALVIQVRSAAVAMGLTAGQTYTTYSDVGRDTLLLVLTASPRDCLCPVTWSYPFVGRVPYKGYFDPAAAQSAAREYAGRGYDVHLRPSAAFSTLGWFNDPLLSTAVGRDSVELAALVFHEIAHNTLWVDHATAFNESFAQWVGYRAAEQFFRDRGDIRLALRAADRWHDEQILGHYYDALLGRLDSLYARHPASVALQAGRDSIASWSRDTLLSPFGMALRTVDPHRIADQPINNAALLGVRLYRTGLDWFEDWWYRNDESIGLAVQQLVMAMEGASGDQAWQRLEALLGQVSGSD